MMTEDCKLQERQKVKDRVRGGTGPDRKLLPSFQQIGMLDAVTFRNLEADVISLLASKPEDHNDIATSDAYEIAQACKLKTYFPNDYRQYLFQVTGERPDDAHPVPDEWEYQNYLPEMSHFGDYIRPFANPHFRSRLAVVPPGGVLDWHIDTNTSYACRVMIVVHGIHVFRIKRKKELHQKIMRQGEIWFCNTGYSHQVEVLSDEPRVAIVLGCHYDAISEWVKTNDVPV